MDNESPLQRLRRLEQEERAKRAGQTSAPAGGSVKKSKKGFVAGAVAVLLLLASKGKFLALLLLTKGKILLVALKIGPLLTTFSTMGLSMLLYGRFFGVRLAVLFVLAILIHELGHGLAARLMGLRVSAPIFIPFFGALIIMKEQPKTTWVEGVVGFGGPFAGMLAGVAALVLSQTMSSAYWSGLLAVTAWLTFIINLFNLYPVGGLDGDRISKLFESWHWIPGCLALVAVLVFTAEYGQDMRGILVMDVIFIALLGGRKFYLAYRRRHGGQRLLERLTEQNKYVDEAKVQAWQRRAAALAYFTLAALLCILALTADGLRPATASLTGN